MLENIEKYAKAINANEEVMAWLATTAKKAVTKKLTTEDELEHIIDFLTSSKAPTRLQKMSFVDAKRKAKEWSDANKKKGKDLTDSDADIETIHDFLDGTKIVKLLTKKALQREGYLMSHCVGGYNPDTAEMYIYSYRDSKNMPHATFEVRKSGKEIVQIKGKGNGAIHPKYIHPILAFLKAVGVDIRPNDMKNLGYYHVPDVHVEFLKSIPQAWCQITMINGVAYARDKV